MTRKIFTIMVFGIVCFAMLELSYRVYVFGFSALRPAVINSMTTILDSGLIKASDDLEIYFELLPNLDTLHNGIPFTTNSDGLADREYSKAKPPGVFRVAVIGSSWTMPTSVEHQRAWHAVLEEQLNQREDGRRYEFINFGVELYGLGELVGTLRSRVMEYEPDLVIVGITSLTAFFVREKYTEPFVVPKRRNPFFESFVLRALDTQLGQRFFAPPLSRPTIGWDAPAHREQTEAALRDLAAIASERNVDIAIVWLGFRPLLQKFKSMVIATTAELGMPLVLGYRPVVRETDGEWGSSFADPRYQVNRLDSHPNEAGHVLIAKEVEKGLFPIP